MEIKRNEATRNRPAGDRVIDASCMQIDIPRFIQQLKQEDAWQKNDRNAITVFKTSTANMVLLCLHAKAELKDNLVDGIFTVQVIEGIIRVTNPDGQIDLPEGHIMAFHQLVDHSMVALTDAVVLLSTIPADINKTGKGAGDTFKGEANTSKQG
jgi:hypothetical protein